MISNNTITQGLDHSIVYNSLLLQLLKEQADIGANLLRISLAEFFLQLCNDLGECALAVAALEHEFACSLKLDGSFRKQDNAGFFASGLRALTPAASGSEAWLACVRWRSHRYFSSMRNAPGGGHPGWT